MREILLDADLDHAERFTQMVMEERARLEQSLIPSGHSLVGTRLGGALSTAGAYAELCGGTSYLEYIRALSARVRNDWPSLLEDLRRLHSLVAALPETPTERAATLSLTADAATLEAALPLFRDTALALPRRTDSSASVRGLYNPAPKDSLFPHRSIMWVWAEICATRAMPSMVLRSWCCATCAWAIFGIAYVFRAEHTEPLSVTTALRVLWYFSPTETPTWNALWTFTAEPPTTSATSV